MLPVRPGQRIGPARQRRRQRRASSGQTHVYDVPNHLDEPNIVRWGVTAEQGFFVLIAGSAFALLTIALLLGGLFIVRPLTGHRAEWWNLVPLVFLIPIRFLPTLARLSFQGMGPFEYLLLRVTTWRRPTYATWLPEEYRDAFTHHHPPHDGPDAAPPLKELAYSSSRRARPGIGTGAL